MSLHYYIGLPPLCLPCLVAIAFQVFLVSTVKSVILMFLSLQYRLPVLFSLTFYLQVPGLRGCLVWH